MDINVTFTLTLSERLFGLLENNLPRLGQRMQKAVTKELSAAAREAKEMRMDVATAPIAEVPKEEAKPEPQAPVEAPQLPLEASVEVPQAVAEAEAAKPLTEEDIRSAMHRTRQRFEGDNYKENTESEYYKKYHRQLTGIFKQIAAVLGSDKPSTLPAEKRADFIRECDELVIGEDGKIETKTPF